MSRSFFKKLALATTALVPATLAVTFQAAEARYGSSPFGGFVVPDTTNLRFLAIAFSGKTRPPREPRLWVHDLD
ncbi:hypothetical protein QEZ48_15575 [Aquamicrobium lusatiense]|uniref:hypothetical protein n=1 Tax=Aquamicrobium lusatiense TaxID=89772 RepID=UPI002455D919|nr:hypothetical protein [Aquamicrobium lusatiense]MDH4992237.1 hypothetical protein [Aquamicrobium lusatiense]